MVKPDSWIRKMSLEHGMIEPFADGISRSGKISYGLSSYGYDMRISDHFKVFTGCEDATAQRAGSGIIDPKALTPESFKDMVTDVLTMEPHSSALGLSVEYFRIPRNIITVTFGKSTYARCGVVVNVTPFEPEWEGYVTLEFSNTTPLPAKIYANEGVVLENSSVT